MLSIKILPLRLLQTMSTHTHTHWRTHICTDNTRVNRSTQAAHVVCCILTKIRRMRKMKIMNVFCFDQIAEPLTMFVRAIVYITFDSYALWYGTIWIIWILQLISRWHFLLLFIHSFIRKWFIIIFSMPLMDILRIYYCLWARGIFKERS